MDLSGAVDTHVHTSPDVLARTMDDRELAGAAAAAGYAAVVLKSHVESTAGRAWLASGPRLRVYGGVCLNQHCTGGVNPAAVEACFRAGGRVVWLPTFTAASARASSPQAERLGRVRGEGVRLTAGGELTAATREVLDLVAAHDGVLATGHVHGPELRAVVAGAARHGVRRVLVQHPESPATPSSVAEQRELLAAHPDAVFERCLRSVAPEVVPGRLVPERRLAPVLAAIGALGVDRTVLATDYGLAGACDPVTAMGCYVDSLVAAGVSPDAVRSMLCAGPARLLGEG